MCSIICAFSETKNRNVAPPPRLWAWRLGVEWTGGACSRRKTVQNMATRHCFENRCVQVQPFPCLTYIRTAMKSESSVSWRTHIAW